MRINKCANDVASKNLETVHQKKGLPHVGGFCGLEVNHSSFVTVYDLQALLQTKSPLYLVSSEELSAVLGGLNALDSDRLDTTNFHAFSGTPLLQMNFKRASQIIIRKVNCSVDKKHGSNGIEV